jgi:hypothetical protein
MRLTTLAVGTLIVLAGCQKEAATPPPAPKTTVKQVTTTAPPVAIEGKQEFAVAFAQPDLLASFVVGTKSGTATQAAKVAKKADVVAFDVVVKNVPAGLAATVEVFDAKDTKVYSERKLVPASKTVSMAWNDPKKKAGEYKVRLFLGGDQYAEQPLTINK